MRIQRRYIHSHTDTPRDPRLQKGDTGQREHTHWGRQRRPPLPPQTRTPTHAHTPTLTTHPHSPHTHGGGVESPSPRASWLQRDKVTHPGALSRARCELTRARRPRASDAGRRRRLGPSTSASRRARAGSGAGSSVSHGQQRTCAVAPLRPSLFAAVSERSRWPPRSRAPASRGSRCACAPAWGAPSALGLSLSFSSLTHPAVLGAALAQGTQH